MDSGKSKKVNKSVISDNVFVILGYLDDYVSKKLYKAASANCVVLAVWTNFNCVNTGAILCFLVSIRTIRVICTPFTGQSVKGYIS